MYSIYIFKSVFDINNSFKLVLKSTRMLYRSDKTFIISTEEAQVIFSFDTKKNKRETNELECNFN